MMGGRNQVSDGWTDGRMDGGAAFRRHCLTFDKLLGTLGEPFLRAESSYELRRISGDGSVVVWRHCLMFDEFLGTLGEPLFRAESSYKLRRLSVDGWMDGRMDGDVLESEAARTASWQTMVDARVAYPSKLGRTTTGVANVSDNH